MSLYAFVIKWSLANMFVFPQLQTYKNLLLTIYDFANLCFDVCGVSQPYCLIPIKKCMISIFYFFVEKIKCCFFDYEV